MANSSVSIIGTGNMAESLLRAFKKNRIIIDGVYGRNEKRLSELKNGFDVEVYNDFTSVSPESIVFLCVPDDVVEPLSNRFRNELKLVHTSGSVEMDQIQADERAVFYPLQTMTQGREIDFSNVPILIESNMLELESELINLGNQLSTNVQKCNSEERKKIHLSAVILNNFVTQLTKMSHDFLKNNGLKSDILQPLLKETVNKISDLGAEDALTGPAKRGDKATISSHLDLLNGDLRLLYEQMSNIILKENGKL
jgi:predicted short-subunit dehydrogenase-like oxidoreductase (DUF2520 family)